MRKASNENKPVMHTDLARLDAREVQPEESDDIPELTDAWFDKAKPYRGETLLRPGSPPADSPKKLISLRLDPDVVEAFRAGGPGWESRINAALRKHLSGGQR